MNELIKALLQVQREVKHAIKDATNPHFKNDYATLGSVLDEVKPIANKYGIVISQINGKDEHGHFTETKLMHESGQVHSSRTYLIIDKQNMQGLGSALTYSRRYELVSIFGITQVDDDANQASINQVQPSWNKQSQMKGASNANKRNEL